MLKVIEENDFGGYCSSTCMCQFQNVRQTMDIIRADGYTMLDTIMCTKFRQKQN